MTIKDIAKKCHVGVSTVSRAMNNHPDINPETKEKILKVIEEANYVPNNSARNLKRNDAKAIAVLVKGIGNTFFSELVGILERECEKKGYSCILQYVDEQEDEWDVAIRVGKEKRLRGLAPILGETLLEAASGDLTAGIATGTLAAGFAAPFVTGCLACKFMIEIVKRGKLIWFSLYCALAGLVSILSYFC